MLDIRRGHVLFLIGITLAVAFAFQGSRGLYETTEGRYAEVAREMLVRGNLLEPTLSFEPHWTKPPLAYWAIAGGLEVFGVNTWGARIPGAVAFALTVLVVVAAGSRLWDRETGLLAGLVYAASPFAVVGAASVSTDVFLALFVAAGFLGYAGAWTSGSVRHRRWWIRAMWAAFGLAFLTKGPPGVLTLLPLLVFHLRSRPGFRFFEPLGLVAFVLVGGWWYAVVEIRHPGLLKSLFMGEIVERNLTDASNRNPEWYKPFVIYLPVLLFGAGAFLWPGVRFVRRRVGGSVKVWRRLVFARDTRASLLLLFVLLPLVVFSLSKSRLPFYLLPLWIAVALALGRAAAETFTRPFLRSAAIAGTTALLLVAAKEVMAGTETKKDMQGLAGAVAEADGGDLPVYSLDRGELHGLEFYLGRTVREIPREEIDAFVADLDGPAILVAREREAKRIAESGLERGPEVQRWTGYAGNAVLRVRPR